MKASTRDLQLEMQSSCCRVCCWLQFPIAGRNRRVICGLELRTRVCARCAPPPPASAATSLSAACNFWLNILTEVS